jgi:hypothetical protein
MCVVPRQYERRGADQKGRQDAHPQVDIRRSLPTVLPTRNEARRIAANIAELVQRTGLVANGGKADITKWGRHVRF